MIGFCLNPIPPMAPLKATGKLGLFLQVVDPVEFRLIVSQLDFISPPLQPPQMSTLLKPLRKIGSNWIKVDQTGLNWIRLDHIAKSTLELLC